MANPTMKKVDIITASMIIPMCFYVFYESGTWPLPALLGNPLLIPRLVASSLLVAAGMLLLRSLAARSRILESRLQGLNLWRVSGVAVLTGGYVFTLERVGFVPTTFIFLLLFGLVLGERRWSRLIFFAIIVPAAIHIIFDATLNVPLPRGLFR